MKLTRARPQLCVYRRSGFRTVLLHLCLDGTIWNPPGDAEARWQLASSDEEVRFLTRRGVCTARLRWDGERYQGVLLDSINASLEIYRGNEFVPRPWKGRDEDARRELTVITVANSFRTGFAELWKSCRYWGIAPLVLGFGRHFRGMTSKVHLLYHALTQLHGALTTVMFLDGFDTLVVAPAADIMRAFRDFGRPLVFSAERNCAPKADRSERYPPAPTPYRFLNSGTFIGDASYLLTLLARWDVVHWPTWSSDQLLFTDAFLADPSSITLDHECRLFQCLYASGADVQVDEHGIYNRTTGSRPLVVHANGGTDLSLAVDWLGNNRQSRPNTKSKQNDY